VPVPQGCGRRCRGPCQPCQVLLHLDTPNNRAFVEKIAKKYQTVTDYEEDQAYTDDHESWRRPIEKAGTVEDTNKLISILETIEWDWFWGTIKARGRSPGDSRHDFGEVVAAPASQQDLPFPVFAQGGLPYIRKPIIVPADQGGGAGWKRPGHRWILAVRKASRACPTSSPRWSSRSCTGSCRDAALPGGVWLTLVFGMMDVLKPGRTALLYMFGAYFAYTFLVLTGNFWLSMLIAPVLVGILGSFSKDP